MNHYRFNTPADRAARRCAALLSREGRRRSRRLDVRLALTRELTARAEDGQITWGEAKATRESAAFGHLVEALLDLDERFPRGMGATPEDVRAAMAANVPYVATEEQARIGRRPPPHPRRHGGGAGRALAGSVWVGQGRAAAGGPCTPVGKNAASQAAGALRTAEPDAGEDGRLRRRKDHEMSRFAEQLLDLSVDLGAKADMWRRENVALSGYLEEAAEALSAAASAVDEDEDEDDEESESDAAT